MIHYSKLLAVLELEAVASDTVSLSWLQMQHFLCSHMFCPVEEVMLSLFFKNTVRQSSFHILYLSDCNTVTNQVWSDDNNSEYHVAGLGLKLGQNTNDSD
jgi:hypothetical protein